MFAIIETGGKQYKVSEGDVVYIEKIDAENGADYTFDRVFAVSGDEGFRVGTPTLDGATVTATVEKTARGKKIYVMRYKAKKNEKKKLGHRQSYTKVTIKSINA